ncbi:DUF2975 domain-containing protein [Salinimicrobium soli]|uniref:DUF2975 domain-containing protein n=1 Tax=Salinimicrobium soli TaxID=1254399 RepID=UPI003AAF7531
MKQPILLKTILDVCLILLFFSFFGSFLVFLIGLFGNNFAPMELNHREISMITPEVISLVIAQFIVSGLLVYTVYLLRKLVRNFFKGKLFTLYQIASLKLIGQLIILVILLQGVLDFLGGIFLSEKVRMGIQMDLSFGSLWFILAIGLFFIYLSKIFDNARRIKEENELTV